MRSMDGVCTSPPNVAGRAGPAISNRHDRNFRQRHWRPASPPPHQDTYIFLLALLPEGAGGKGRDFLLLGPILWIRHLVFSRRLWFPETVQDEPRRQPPKDRRRFPSLAYRTSPRRAD